MGDAMRVEDQQYDAYTVVLYLLFIELYLYIYICVSLGTYNNIYIYIYTDKYTLPFLYIRHSIRRSLCPLTLGSFWLMGSFQRKPDPVLVVTVGRGYVYIKKMCFNGKLI